MMHLETMRQMFVAGTTLAASLSSGAAMGYPSVLLYQLRSNTSSMELNLDSASWIGSIHGLAGILSIIMPAIMQWQGRKLAFILSSISLLIGWILAYIAQTVTVILLSESFHGFGANSLLTVSYICISEMVTPKYRNIYIQSYGISQALGMASSCIMTKLVHWKTVSIVMGIPIIIAMLLALLWPESPFWLSLKGKKEKCEVSFLWLRGNDGASLKELDLLIASKNVTNKLSFKKLWLEVTSKDFYVPSLHIFILFFLTYWSGGIVIILYSIELLQKTTKNENAAFIGSISINFILFFGIFIGTNLVRIFSNKSVLIFSSLFSAVFLFGASLTTYLQSKGVLLESSLVCLFMLVGYMIASSIGLLPITYSVSAELMPVKYRGIGGAISMLITCILHTFSLKTSPYLFLYIGLDGTFLLYSLNIIICITLIYIYLPETKGRSLHEIEHFYLFGTFENKIDVENEAIVAVPC